MKSISYIAASVLLVLGAEAAEMSSTNYSISWDVADGGGGLMTSPNYVLVDSVGQPTAVGMSSSDTYVLQAGFHAPPDTDTDLVRDFMDNCTLDPNSDQFDSNGDGFGNWCDADINDDLTVNLLDLLLFRAAFLTSPEDLDWNPAADFNNDQVVNLLDLLVFRGLFLMPPGPSGIAP